MSIRCPLLVQVRSHVGGGAPVLLGNVRICPCPNPTTLGTGLDVRTKCSHI